MNQTLSLGWTEAQAQARLFAYRRLLKANLLLQAAFGALCVLFPAWTIAWLGLAAEPSAWVRAWGAMVLLVSLLYVPAWYAPVRARFAGPVGLLGRFLTGTLYLLLALSGPELRGFLWMALFDLGFAVALSFSYFALFRAELMSRP
jgi:hypothetical protein